MSNETSSSNSTTGKEVKKTSFTKEDFEFGDQIGEGAYSRVILTTFKQTGKKYATKVILKQLVVSQNKVKTVKMEKEVLNMMDHPNIIKLFCTYQDKENLYFALELAPGGELFSYLSKYGPFSFEATQFYTAEIVNALEYMHSLNIIHRDLKPENIILSKDMHTKITDFGTAKILTGDNSDAAEVADQMKRNSRTTFCGTAEYVSPEVLRNDPSTKASDLWALGCIVYQFLTGSHPFKAESEYLIFKKILGREFEFPSNFPEVAKDFVDKLLRLNTEERLGTGTGGYAELKSHPFFNGINFEKLNEMIPPRIVPHHIESQEKGNGTDDQSRWSLFLLKNERVIYHSTIIKRRKLTAKRRQLILTDRPRLVYVDPNTMVLKGIIPWTKDLKFVKKSDKDFLIQTPKRNYIMEDLNNSTDEWERVITQALSKFKQEFDQNIQHTMKRRREEETSSGNKKHKKIVISLDSDDDADDSNMTTVIVVEKKTGWSHKMAFDLNTTTQLALKNLIHKEYTKVYPYNNDKLSNYLFSSSGRFLVQDDQRLSLMEPKIKNNGTIYLFRKGTDSVAAVQPSSTSTSTSRSAVESDHIIIDDEEDEDDVEDEELKRAIALSLQDNSTVSTTSSDNSSQQKQLRFDGSQIYLNKLSDGTNFEQHVVTLKEILDTDHLEAAFMCTYSFELEFFKSLFPYNTRMIPVTLVKHWSSSDDKEGRSMFQIGKSPLCVINPPLGNLYSSMHSKLWLLSFPDYLRVVVSSANLSTFDWECYTQTIWIQDFPKVSANNKPAAKKHGNDFKEALVNFWNISTMNLPSKWLNSFDFSGANAHLVCSVPGYHKLGDLEKYGHMRIRELLRKYDTATLAKNSTCYYQISSIGSLNTKWLEEVASSFKTKLPKSKTDLTGLKIIFPSKTTVHNSTLGVRAGGMIHIRKNTYQAVAFPKQVMCDYENAVESQKNHLSHSKILVYRDSSSNTRWLYVGSHNLSGAALGKLQKNNTQIYISNYEVGVLLIGEYAKRNDSRIPFKIPPQVYSSTTEPFYEEDHH